MLALLLLMRGLSAPWLMLAVLYSVSRPRSGDDTTSSDKFQDPQLSLVVPRDSGVTVLVPKLATTLKEYTRQQFANDLVAGVIVGVVALPLAIAFAIA
ncbi:MAG TPA: hypothetical protein VFB89_01715, partial [Gemmatimonadales bacterium]|nr:hypothetical protein [Gemmatimonadales bacterium]